MIRVCIGWDRRETIAWAVLADSLIRRSRAPLALTPVGNATLPESLWWRPRGPHDATEFSCARFAVPALMGFEGWALFMDCDMLATADLAQLWALRDDRYAVLVRQHRHEPTNATKFLGQHQVRYPRKNWSSLMLMNCAHPACKTLLPEYINSAPGLNLHTFAWCPDEAIGALPEGWNDLILHDTAQRELEGELLHFTDGGPWHGHIRQPGASLWLDALDLLLSNPSGQVHYSLRATASDGEGVDLSIRYRRR